MSSALFISRGMMYTLSRIVYAVSKNLKWCITSSLPAAPGGTSPSVACREFNHVSKWFKCGECERTP